MGIYAALSDTTLDEVCTNFGGEQFSTFKQNLADLAVSKLAPIQDEMRRLMADPAYVDGVLRGGAQKARNMAQPIIDEVKATVGYLKP
jgi:tryptophanyl-tRNA synthetase